MRALVVDDSRIMRLMVRQQLHGCGVLDDHICEAGDGREALDQLASGDIDVVLSDVNMPVMDGEQLLYALNRNDFFDQGRVVMVTSRYERGLFRRLLEHGASAIIRKPFTADSFRRQLEPVFQEISDARGGNATLRRLPAREAPELINGSGLDPVTIDPNDTANVIAAKAAAQVLRTLGLQATVAALAEPAIDPVSYAEIPVLGDGGRSLVLYGDDAACNAFSLRTTGLPADDDEVRADVMGEIANIVAGHWLATVKPAGASGFDMPRTGRADAAEVVWEGIGLVEIDGARIWARVV